MSVVKAYVAAIVNLWSFQKSKGLNTHPTPRGEYRWRRLEFADRAAGTLQDGYDEAKIINAVRFCWQGRKQSIEPYLRTAVDFCSPTASYCAASPVSLPSSRLLHDLLAGRRPDVVFPDNHDHKQR